MKTMRETLLDEQIARQAAERALLPHEMVAQIDAEALRKVALFRLAFVEVAPEDPNFTDPDYGL